MSLAIDCHIGQYRILRKIGAGGMGTVFIGEHILLGRRAAIKTLLPALSMQKEIVERFFTEARATSAISDPGVVQVFDFGYHVDGTAYIVMELLEGEALSTRLERVGRLPAVEALRIGRQVAGALAAAHACSIVHRDLKPDNVFLIPDAEAQGGERAKILDFGICKLDRADTTLTQSGVMLGTPVYMSPEQCQGAGRVDQRSDIYSLGCVMFHMLTGRAPFECDGTGDLIVAHLQQDAPAPSTTVPDLSEAIDELIARCVEKAPEARFQSMAELQEAIEWILPRLDAAPIASRQAIEAIEGPAALALGPGFKSNYNGNLGTSVPTQDAEPMTSNAWFIAPTPTTLRSASGETELPTSRSSTRSLVAIMLAATLVALAAITFTQINDETATAAVVVPPVVTPVAAPAVVPSDEEPVPAATVEPATPPADPPADKTAAVVDTSGDASPSAVADKPAADKPAADKPAADTAAKTVDKPVTIRRKPTPPSKRPVAQRQVRRAAPAPSTPPPEDLYDTR